jgi:hypothetical protein
MPPHIPANVWIFIRIVGPHGFGFGCSLLGILFLFIQLWVIGDGAEINGAGKVKGKREKKEAAEGKVS